MSKMTEISILFLAIIVAHIAQGSDIPDLPLLPDEHTAVLYRFEFSEPDSAASITVGTDSTEQGGGAIRLEDGGILIGGTTRTPGEGYVLSDILLIWLNNELEEISRRSFPIEGRETLTSMCSLPNGDILLLGETDQNSDDFQRTYDILLMRLEPDGEPIWTRSFGVEDERDGPEALAVNGECILVTARTRLRARSQATIYKLDLEGNLIWTRIFGGAWSSAFNDVDIQSDSTYLLSGYNMVQGRSNEAFLVNLSASGDTLLEQTYGTAELSETIHSTLVYNSLIYSCGGSVNNDGGYSDYYAQCIDPAGNFLWSNTYTLDNQRIEFGRQIINTLDGNLLIAGRAAYFGQDPVYVGLLKISPAGEQLWLREIYGTTLGWISSLWQESDGGYVITCTAPVLDRSDDFFILRTFPDIPMMLDYSENKRHGSVWGEVTSTEGLDGQAAGFGNENTGALIIPPVCLPDSTGWTIEFFFRSFFELPRETLLMLPSASDTIPSLHVFLEGESNRIVCQLSWPGDTVTCMGDAALGEHNWIYLACWFDKRNFGLTIDDSLVEQIRLPDLRISTSEALLIGRTNLGESDSMQFNGLIDEFRISNMARDYLVPEDRVEVIPQTPFAFHLPPPYPNPCNSSTTISFSLPPTLAGGVSLAIYDLSGRLVHRFDTQALSHSGTHSLVWDAGDLGSGVYVVRLEGAEKSVSQKIVLIR